MTINYEKLTDPTTEIRLSAEALINGAFGRMTGDGRETTRRIHAHAGALYALLMDVITNVGLEGMAQRHGLRQRFDQYTDAIVDDSQALLNDYDGPLNDEQAVAMQFIHEIGAEMIGMINRLFLYSRLHSNLIVPTLAAYNLHIDPSTLPQPTNDVGLYVALPPDLPEVYADASLVTHCLHLLVENAVRFTQSGHVRITARTHVSKIEISVSDTGRGIAARDHVRVFDPFFQVNPADDGLGLGLTIAHMLAEHQRGLLRLRSTPNLGTILTLVLPAAEHTDIE